VNAGPRIAVFGGSFDPPHVGHVLLAAWALSAGGIDRLLVVPTFAHAFAKRSAPFEDRVAMARLAFSLFDPARVEVSDLESRLPPPSYTVRTLEAVQAAWPDASLRLLVGSDILADLPRWREAERIEAIAPLLVGGRAGHARDGAGRRVEESVPSFPEVSSTEIRGLLAAGRRPAHLVPEPVLAHIVDRALYAEGSP
jgi:nicotinate-nucleotide adenylyltransferase